HGGYPAGEPLREGGCRGDRTERQSLYRAIDRHDARGPQPDDGFAFVRRNHGRAEIIHAARPFGVPLGTRPGHPQHPAPTRLPRRAGSRLTMAPPLVQLREIKLTFGGAPLLTSVELNVSANERVG